MFRSLEKAIRIFLVVRTQVSNSECQPEFRALFAYLNHGSVEYLFSNLNLLHNNIQFSFEQDKNDSLPFLDVLIIRDCDKINTIVYRKNKHSDLYSHWKLFSPISWKRGALKSLTSRAYISSIQIQEKNLSNIKKERLMHFETR